MTIALRQASIVHGGADQAGDATAGRACPQERHALLGERHAGDVDGGQQGAGRHGCRALDIVIEGAEPVAIALEQARRIVLREILPLQQDMWPALHHGRDEGLDEVVIVLTAYALVAPADIEGIAEAVGIIGSDIEQDRQGRRGMQAATARIERELADRDAHAAGALVPQAEDALAIGHDDRLDRVEARLSKDAIDPVLVRNTQKQPARLAVKTAELLTACADGGRVYDRQQLFQILDQQRVEQSLVGVLQLPKDGVALEIGLVAAQRLQAARYLLVQRRDIGREQAVKVELLALGLGERCTLVELRIGQQLVSAQRRGRESCSRLGHDKLLSVWNAGQDCITSRICQVVSVGLTRRTPRMARGPTRVQLKNKDPRSWQ